MGIKSTDGTLIEAEVIINGRTLNFAQSMTLRVALSSFLMYCNNKENDIGPISEGYADACRGMLHFIHEDIKETRGVPSLTDEDLGTEREISRLENCLRFIAQKYAVKFDDTNLQDDISRALRGKSL